MILSIVKVKIITYQKIFTTNLFHVRKNCSINNIILIHRAFYLCRMTFNSANDCWTKAGSILIETLAASNLLTFYLCHNSFCKFNNIYIGTLTREISGANIYVGNEDTLSWAIFWAWRPIKWNNIGWYYFRNCQEPIDPQPWLQGPLSYASCMKFKSRIH